MDTTEEAGDAIPGILVLTHGRVGEEMIRSAEMIVGPMEGVFALSLMPGMAVNAFREEVKRRLETLPDGSLLISDLFGGTPANTSAFVSQIKNIAAVSGLSLSMLIEAASLRTELSGEELAEAVLSAGKEGCKNVLDTLRKIG